MINTRKSKVSTRMWVECTRNGSFRWRKTLKATRCMSLMEPTCSSTTDLRLMDGSAISTSLYLTYWTTSHCRSCKSLKQMKKASMRIQTVQTRAWKVLKTLERNYTAALAKKLRQIACRGFAITSSTFAPRCLPSSSTCHFPATRPIYSRFLTLLVGERGSR
jgi:glutamine synthetase adenylyltransferase